MFLNLQPVRFALSNFTFLSEASTLREELFQREVDALFDHEKVAYVARNWKGPLIGFRYSRQFKNFLEELTHDDILEVCGGNNEESFLYSKTFNEYSEKLYLVIFQSVSSEHTNVPARCANCSSSYSEGYMKTSVRVIAGMKKVLKIIKYNSYWCDLCRLSPLFSIKSAETGFDLFTQLR